MIIYVTQEDAARYDILLARYNRLEHIRQGVKTHKMSHYFDLIAMVCQEIAELVCPVTNPNSEVSR